MNDTLDDQGVKRIKTNPDRYVYLTQKEINDNHYIIEYFPPKEGLHPVKNKISVTVWATPDGVELSLPDHPNELRGSYGEDNYIKLAEERMQAHIFDRKDLTFDSLLTKVINEAVCELENKQEEEQKYVDSALAALDANKEVHEDLDYKLDSN